MLSSDSFLKKGKEELWNKEEEREKQGRLDDAGFVSEESGKRSRQ